MLKFLEFMEPYSVVRYIIYLQKGKKDFVLCCTQKFRFYILFCPFRLAIQAQSNEKDKLDSKLSNERSLKRYVESCMPN